MMKRYYRSLTLRRNSNGELYITLHHLTEFTDVEGCVIHDLHEIFEVWKLDAWKKSRANASILEDRHGDQWGSVSSNSARRKRYV